MNAVEVSTVVHADRAAIYDFLVDFEGYANYSEYVEDVTRTGDGGPGTEYAITVSWWELGYTAESAVTATDPPDRIDWRLVGGLDANGHWRIEDAPGETNTIPDDGPDDGAPTNRVVLRIEYDPDSVSGSSLSLPAFVPLDAVVDRVRPHVQSEAESVVADVVADLEGERRDVTLTVHEPPEND